MPQVQVYGVRETIKELQAFDDKARFKAAAKIKKAAEPLRAAIASDIPSTPPLSGWAHRGRTGWLARGATKVVAKYGGRARRDRDTWPLVRIVLTGAANSMYDMAGRGGNSKSRQGDAFIDNLPGRASRAAWPNAEQMLPAVQAAVLEAVREVMDQVNRNLVTKGG